MKVVGTRSLKKYIIFPCCLLIFGALEELFVYKTEVIANPYLQVGALMIFFAFGIALLAYLVVPVVERIVLRLHAASRFGAGRIGEYIFILVLLAIVYFIWFQIFVHGPQSVLPANWHN